MKAFECVCADKNVDSSVVCDNCLMVSRVRQRNGCDQMGDSNSKENSTNNWPLL